MISHIRIQNSFSCKDVMLDFRSNNYGSLKNNVFDIYYTKSKKTTLTKSTLIYWPNASGKTNFLRSVRFFYNIALDSFIKGASVVPFLLDGELNKQPSSFEIGFFVEKEQYIYKISVQDATIVNESLSHEGTSSEMLFERQWQDITASKNFAKEVKKADTQTRPDASFLSTLSHLNGQLADRPLKECFPNMNFTENDFWSWYTAEWIYKNPDKKDLVIQVFQQADIHISDIEIEKVVKETEDENTWTKKIEETYRPMFIRQTQDQKKIGWSYHLESWWTKKLFNLLFPLLDTIFEEKILWVDEIENQFHPLLLDNIFSLIHAAFPDKKYQFVFTTHDIHLLDLNTFKKEQIVLANKNEDWSTELYSLRDFYVRKENDIKNMYLNGAFGAVPQVIDFSLLFDEAWA